MMPNLLRHLRRRAFVRVGFIAAVAVLAVEAGGCRRDGWLTWTTRFTGATDHVLHTVWTDGWTRVSVTVRGDVEFTDDEHDVSSISPNGSFELTARGWLSLFGRRYDVRPLPDGTLSRRFMVNGTERPRDAAARALISAAIGRLVAQGYAADARVARLLAEQGPAGVLELIPRLPSDYLRMVYFRYLLERATLDDAMAERMLTQAAVHIHSPFQLARTLEAFVEHEPMSDAVAPALVAATNAIRSDFQRTEVLARLIVMVPRTEAGAMIALASSAAIGSDFLKARVLTRFLATYDVDNTTAEPFFAAVRMIKSDFERSRVLSSLAKRQDLDSATVVRIVQAASSIRSDSQKSRLLLRLIATHPAGKGTADALLEAAHGIGSEHERGRVLSAMLGAGALR
jgi:hypothetical protein